MALLGSLSSGISALRSFSKGIETIGNNIANANTVGFKSSSVQYTDTFSNLLRRSGKSQEGGGGSNVTALQVGTGVQVSSINTKFSQGTIESTGVSSHMAVAGEGFFTVRDSLNNTNYVTRSGEFRVDDRGYITTQDGFRLQGLTGSNIQYKATYDSVADKMNYSFITPIGEQTNPSKPLNTTKTVSDMKVTFDWSSPDETTLAANTALTKAALLTSPVTVDTSAAGSDSEGVAWDDSTPPNGALRIRSGITIPANTELVSKGTVTTLTAAYDLGASGSVLGGTATLGGAVTPTGQVTLGDLGATAGTGGISLGAGTSLNGTTTLGLDLALTANFTVPSSGKLQTEGTITVGVGGIAVTAGSSIQTPPNTTFKSGSVVNGTTLTSDTLYTQAMTLITGDSIAVGTILPKNTTFNGGQVIPNGTTIPASTVLPSGSTFTAITVIPAGSTFSGGTQFPAGTAFPANTVLSAGTSMPSPGGSTTLPIGTQLAGQVILGGEMTLTSAMTLGGKMTVTGNTLSLGGATTLNNDVTLPSGKTLTLADDMTVNEDITVSQGATLKTVSGTTFQSGSIVQGTLLTVDTFYSAITLQPGDLVKAGTKLPNGTVFSSGQKIPNGTTLPSGTILPISFEIPSGTTLPPNTKFATGTVLPNATRFASPQKLPADTYLPKDFVLPAGTLMDGGSELYSDVPIVPSVSPLKVPADPLNPQASEINRYELDLADPTLNTKALRERALREAPTIQAFNVGQTGNIDLVFSNGATFTIGQVLLTKFNDPQALIREGNGVYSGMGNAGQQMDSKNGVGFYPGGNGVGTLRGESLEQSNVDLTEEFAKMISTQRSFQAASRIITVSDDILQEIVNLKR